MIGPNTAPRRANAAAVLPVAAWVVTALAAVVPGLLLLVFAESRLPRGAAIALLLAGVVAACLSTAWARAAVGPSLGASVVVVLLCSAAPVTLDVDGQMSPAGYALFGGVAAVFAVLAGALTFRARG